MGKMIYKEVKKDIFDLDRVYYKAHCISADFALGKGIAKKFDENYGIREKLKAGYPSYMYFWKLKGAKGDCILVDRVLNLVTKERYFHKPTYNTLIRALMEARDVCIKESIRYLAMPKIGCGLDRLEWDKVSFYIQQVFTGLDIEILVCYL